jgi:hypothetical protein
MTLPQDLTPIVRDWLHEPDELPPPRIAEVSQRVRQTPQERGLRPRLDPGRFPMFSALKFVAASVIVALFGGFLLAVVITLQQEGEVPPAAVTESPEPAVTSEPTEAPTTSVRTDILPGVELTVEAVEPGVFRVVGDGVREGVGGDRAQVVAGHDGSIWLLGEKDFIRLGSPAEKWQKWAKDSGRRELAVAPDGAVWVLDVRNRKGEPVERLRSFKDGSWTVRLRLPGGLVRSWSMGPDGTVATIYEREGQVVARMGADGLEPLAVLGDVLSRDIFVTESGEVWRAEQLGHRLTSDWWHSTEMGSLWRYREDDGGWQEFTTVDALGFFTPGRVEVGVDGTVWFADEEPRMADGEPVLDAEGRPTQGDPFLMRFDGSEWQRWGPADGVPSPSSTDEYFVWGGLEQAPDGALWASHHIRGPGSRTRVAGGSVDRFDPDTSTWQRFLSGRDVGAPAVAADGSVWVLADDDLYVITPEAVAAKEQ